MSSYSRQQLEKWVGDIAVSDSKVLDVGGAQLPIGNRLKSSVNNTFAVLDLVQPHESKAKVDIPWDLNQRITIPFANDFDVAFCLEVSEYWYDPLQALRNINYFLKEHGVLYISFHFVYPVHNPQGQDYLRYTEYGAKKLLNEAGFAIKDIKWRTAEVGSPMALYNAEKMKPSRDYMGHEALGFLVTAVKVPKTDMI